MVSLMRLVSQRMSENHENPRSVEPVTEGLKAGVVMLILPKAFHSIIRNAT